MSRYFLALLGAFAVPMTAAQAGWVEDYESLLRKYVSGSGVRYQAWKAQPADVAKLRGVTGAIGRQSVRGMSRNDQLAFYLNAYNAWILQVALEKYPVKSLKKSEWRFFKKDRIVVAGKKMSFDDLEHGLIRPRFAEARVHFALNCAARSCPPLHGKAFRGKTLDRTLDSLTRTHLHHWRGVSESKGKVYVSKLFDWFEKDFVQSGGSVRGFIEKYRKLPRDVDGYLDYDWSLNEAR